MAEQINFLNHKKNIRVTRFGGKDLIPSIEKLRDLQELIEDKEDLYPGIYKWFRGKVVPELKSQSLRSAILLYDAEKPIAATVIRRGKRAKICSLRVNDDYQSQGLGSLLMNLIAAEIRHDGTESIHFTIATHMWEGKVGDFLKGYGFEFISKANIQYRQRQMDIFDNDPELACVASFSTFWANVQRKIDEGLENFELNGAFGELDLLISIHPKYAEQIIREEKQIEVRRRFSMKWLGAKVLIYATDPVRALVGEAKISEIYSGEPQRIWDEWKNELGCTYDEFLEYTKGKDQIHAIRLTSIFPYAIPIPLSQLEFHVQSNLPIPQSYFDINNQQDWQTAIKWGSLLNANR